MYCTYTCTCTCITDTVILYVCEERNTAESHLTFLGRPMFVLYIAYKSYRTLYCYHGIENWTGTKIRDISLWRFLWHLQFMCACVIIFQHINKAGVSHLMIACSCSSTNMIMQARIYLCYWTWWTRELTRYFDNHPGLPGVLRHSVKLRTLPQDSSLRERVENKSYSDLAGMMTSPTQRTMQCVDLWQ
jgi:hypothetical protein